MADITMVEQLITEALLADRVASNKVPRRNIFAGTAVKLSCREALQSTQQPD
ncbi:hypothetical protein [Collimonas sp.]|uniref:hypothetical protein n=1 Tax=Collimonas sp. TaxID=1963772 RepID=UPI002C131EA5|nr:hypothetical protein [Collimonas sp.]HWX01809.1 hypothetical protein [Collimonas sp.]